MRGARVRAARRRDSDWRLERYTNPAELLADLRTVQDSLAASGAKRHAFGGIQHLIWQVETYGFHLTELEVRQHSQVHREALAELEAGGERSERTEEVLEVFRAIAEIQQRLRPARCRSLRRLVHAVRRRPRRTCTAWLATLSATTGRCSMSCRCSRRSPTCRLHRRSSPRSSIFRSSARAWPRPGTVWRSCSGTRTRPRMSARSRRISRCTRRRRRSRCGRRMPASP